MLRLLCFILCSVCGYAQGNPVASQFDFLMNQPKSIVQALVNYPYKQELPEALPGLNPSSAQGRIRIVSVQKPIDGYSRWKQWKSADGDVWVDLIRFKQPYAATALLGSARQPHSGYHEGNQLLLFSGTGDPDKEAVGAVFITPDGSLLNVGVKLPLAVSWSKPLSDTDRKSFNAALERFQSTLEMLAVQFLDPVYVSFSPRIEAKPESLRLLRIAGFARFWSYVKYNFVYLDRRRDLNWDAVLDQYLPRVAAAKDDIEYGRLLEQAVALLKDGHTNINPNAVELRDAPLILLEPVEGKPVASIVGKLPELQRIEPGMELVSIDEVPVRTVIERDLDPYIASSTIQDRQLRQMRILLQGPPASTIETKWLTLDGKTIEVPLARDGSKNRAALKVPLRDLFEYRKLPNNIAYIGLNSFDNPEITKKFKALFDELRGADAWIIDLRQNGGGSSDIGYDILSHFIAEKVQGSTSRTLQYNPTSQAIGRPQTWHEEGTDEIAPTAGPHYEKPVYVLTSPRTCSAAEDFLIPLRVAKRITIVGEPTCGSSGQPLYFSIYGATGRVCTKWDRFPDGTEFVGIGIIPDIPVARSKKDFATQHDPVLQTALDLIRAAAIPRDRRSPRAVQE